MMALKDQQRQTALTVSNAMKRPKNQVQKQEATPFRKYSLGMQGTYWLVLVLRIRDYTASLHSSQRAGAGCHPADSLATVYSDSCPLETKQYKYFLTTG